MEAPISTHWSSHHSDELAARYRREGSWQNCTLADFLRREVEADPDRDFFWENGRTWTVGEIHEQAVSLAASLHELGIRPGDVISFQLPNWTEAVIIDCAAAIGGFVCNPIVLIYRHAELRQILSDSQSRAIFVPGTYRNVDYAGMLAEVSRDTPHLRHIITVRAPGPLTFDDLIVSGRSRDAHEPKVDPDSPKMIMFTSGTTGRAKGVVHSHNTFHCELEASRRFWGLTRQDRGLVTGPVGHMSGYLYACNGPLQWGSGCAMIERWNGVEAADLIDRLGVSFAVGPTPFLQDLVEISKESGRKFPSLRLFACGGAAVPPYLIRSAHATFANCVAYRCYGSTEAPTTTLGIADGTDIEACATTDGEVYNNDVLIVDEQGNALPTGSEGEILIRGPECMLGYANEADNALCYDEQGYWRSGDLGILDERDRLVVTGRKKDLIIRGGENLSAKEIEDALYLHPHISQVAIVGAPHPRLGEVVCAFIVTRPGHRIDLDELRCHLGSHGLAKEKYPERLEIVSDLPMTPYGKVRKNVLRDELKNTAA